MWVVNLILIFAAIAVPGWLLWNYGDQLVQGLGVLFSGSQAIVFALGIIILATVKAAIVSALVGGAFGLIFFVAGAPKPLPNAVGFIIGCLLFTLLMLKILWENLNDLRRTMRHEVKNRYRNR
jgi:hypothetical protein